MNPMINYGNTQQNSSGGIPEGMVGYQQALFSQGQMGYTIPPNSSQIPIIDSSSIVNNPMVVPQQHNEKMDMALEFLDQVKSAYEDRPQVYMQFLDIMKDFKNQSIDTNGVIERVKTLFEGHPELVQGFNNFLPPPLKIKKHDEYEPEDEEEREDHPPIRTRQRHREAREHLKVEHKTEDFDQARNYVKKIKQRFISQPQVYKSFLEILHTFSRNQISTEDIYYRVSQLFKDHPDLLDEFSNFLPESAIMNQEQQYQPKTRPTRSKTASNDSKTTSPPKRSKKYTEEPIGSNGTFEELMNLFKIKQVLPQVDFKHLLKILDLYNNNIVTKKEVYFFLRNLLKGNHKSLLDWFQEFIRLDDIEEEQEPIEDQAISHEMEPQEIEELNYLLDTNQTALNYLQDLKTVLLKNSSEISLKESDVDEISQEAIRRLYGNKGDDFFDIFIKNPAQVIDILINRLIQKNNEFLANIEEWKNIYQKEKQEDVEKKVESVENKEPANTEQDVKTEQDIKENGEKMEVEEEQVKELNDNIKHDIQLPPIKIPIQNEEEVVQEENIKQVESESPLKEEQNNEDVQYQPQSEVINEPSLIEKNEVNAIEAPSEQSSCIQEERVNQEEIKEPENTQMEVEESVSNAPNDNVKNEEISSIENKGSDEDKNGIEKREIPSILSESNNINQNEESQLNNENLSNQINQ